MFTVVRLLTSWMPASISTPFFGVFVVFVFIAVAAATITIVTFIVNLLHFIADCIKFW